MIPKILKALSMDELFDLLIRTTRELTLALKTEVDAIQAAIRFQKQSPDYVASDPKL